MRGDHGGVEENLGLGLAPQTAGTILQFEGTDEFMCAVAGDVHGNAEEILAHNNGHALPTHIRMNRTDKAERIP